MTLTIWFQINRPAQKLNTSWLNLAQGAMDIRELPTVSADIVELALGDQFVFYLFWGYTLSGMDHLLP